MTLDNNDLNQDGHLTGFSKNKGGGGGGGTQSRGLIKPGLGHSCLRIFEKTLANS